MAKKFIIPVMLVAFSAVGMIFGTGFASAMTYNPAIQSHVGACGMSNLNINEAVANWHALKVDGKFAAAVGIHGADGSVDKQLRRELVIGRAAKAVLVNDTGCANDGHGGTFLTHTPRNERVGEPLAVIPPASVGSNACQRPGMKGCVKRLFTFTVVFEANNCWNLNPMIHVRIAVFIWVHKPASPPKAAPPSSVGSCGSASTTGSANSGTACQGNSASQTASQTATVTQAPSCNNSPNSPNQCQTTSTITQITIQYITQINANCSMVVYSDGTVVYKDASGNTVSICSTTTTSTPPPPPAPTPPSAVVNSTQELYPGETEAIKALITAPAGDKLNVCFTAGFGGFSSSCVSTTSSSPSTVLNTYTAPGEIMTDKVTVIVNDLTTGLSNTNQSDGFNSQPISVIAPPPNPS